MASKSPWIVDVGIVNFDAAVIKEVRHQNSWVIFGVSVQFGLDRRGRPSRLRRHIAPAGVRAM